MFFCMLGAKSKNLFHEFHRALNALSTNIQPEEGMEDLTNDASFSIPQGRTKQVQTEEKLRKSIHLSLTYLDREI